MNYVTLFKEIIDIMSTDYSGCQTKKHLSQPQVYMDKIITLDAESKLNREVFKEIVNDYILDYRDDHVTLLDTYESKVSSHIGFDIRRYNNSLFVTEVYKDCGLSAGDEIVLIDGEAIDELSIQYKKQLKGQPHERQIWNTILSQHKKVSIKNDQGIIEKDIIIYSAIKHTASYKFKRLNEDTCYISFNDFRDYNQVIQMLEAHGEEILSTKDLIVDVRYCLGGSDSVFEPLTDILFPLRTSLKDDAVVMTNMTERNFKNRYRVLSEYSKKVPDDITVKEYIELLKMNRGKGFVNLHPDPGTMHIKGSVFPKKIVVLTDCYTGSSGEGFTYFCTLSDKITLMGRPTHGVIDYSNQAFEELGDGFVFKYSTSVTKQALEGKGFDYVGIQPDVYIPWTPEHILKDIDVEYALKYLKDN